MIHQYNAVQPENISLLLVRCRRTVLHYFKLSILLLAWKVSNAEAGDNLIANPSFEADPSSWVLFVPAESENKGCEFLVSKSSPHSGSTCGELKSSDVARFSVSPKSLQGDIIRPGDHCRLTFWIRAANDLQSTKTPSFIVRVFLLSEQGRALSPNMAIFVGLNGKASIQSPAVELDLTNLGGTIPTKWTKVECVFAVPSDINAGQLGKPEFFAQYISGSIFLDDVSLEEVGTEVVLSPLLKKP